MSIRSSVARGWENLRRKIGAFTGGAAVARLSRSLSAGYSRSKATDAWLDAYNTMPWMRAVSGKIASGVASLEWGLTRTMGETVGPVVKGLRPQRRTTHEKRVQRMAFTERKKTLAKMEQEGNSEPVFDHPFLDFWQSPCPMLPGNLFHRLNQIYLEIAGECFILVERGPRDEIFKGYAKGLGIMRNAPKVEVEVYSGLPTSAYPCPPNWVRRLPTPDRPTFEIQGPSGITFTEVPMSAVWWLKDPDPVAPYLRGSGIMMSLGDELNADENASKMMNFRFYNRGNPEALVTLDGATVEETQKYAADWVANNQGAQNAFKIHFTNYKSTVEKLGDDFREMQLLELRRYMRDMIRQTPGVPPEVLGILENSNRSTIDAADYLFNKYIVVPRAEMWRTFLQERVIPLYDPRAIVDYVSPLVEDKEYSLRVLTSMPVVAQANDWRKMAGLGALSEAEGGTLYIKADGSAVRSLMELAAEPASLPGLPGAGGVALHGGGIHVPGATQVPLEVPHSTSAGALPAAPEQKLLPAPKPAGGGPITIDVKVPKVEVLSKGRWRASRQARRRMKSPDEALLIANVTRSLRGPLPQVVYDDRPKPLTKIREIETVRRAISVLRSDASADGVVRAAKPWEGLLGPWDERAEKWLDSMLQAQQ